MPRTVAVETKCDNAGLDRGFADDIHVIYVAEQRWSIEEIMVNQQTRLFLIRLETFWLCWLVELESTQTRFSHSQQRNRRMASYTVAGISMWLASSATRSDTASRNTVVWYSEKHTAVSETGWQFDGCSQACYANWLTSQHLLDVKPLPVAREVEGRQAVLVGEKRVDASAQEHSHDFSMAIPTRCVQWALTLSSTKDKHTHMGTTLLHFCLEIRISGSQPRLYVIISRLKPRLSA